MISRKISAGKCENVFVNMVCNLMAHFYAIGGFLCHIKMSYFWVFDHGKNRGVVAAFVCFIGF